MHDKILELLYDLENFNPQDMLSVQIVREMLEELLDEEEN